jgi:hypothetical protein
LGSGVASAALHSSLRDDADPRNAFEAVAEVVKGLRAGVKQ